MLASDLCHPRLLRAEERLDNADDAFRVDGQLQVAAGIDVQCAVGWIAPGILEALIPGRMQGHGGTAEVPRRAARARGEDVAGYPGAGREGARGAGPGRQAAGCSPGSAAVLGKAGGN